jgi:MFS family permease
MQKPSNRISPFLSLHIRSYRLFLIGFFISQMGSQMQIIAINWQMYEMTRSPVMLGLIGVVSFVPVLLFSMVGGLTADNVNRKKLLAATQLFLAVVALTLALSTATGIVTPAFIFVLLGLNFAGMAFFGPVRQSIIPDLVPKQYLLNAVSLNTLARNSAVIIGPAIAGFLIALYGVESIYIVNCVALTVAIITILPLKIPAHAKEGRPSWSIASLVEGIRFVKNSKIMLSTILLDFFATFFGSATSLLPIFALEVLAVDARGLGLLYAATSAGAVLSGLILSSVGRLRHQGLIILGSVTLFALATIGFGLSRSFYLSLVFLFIAGAGDMVSTILRNTIRQIITPANMRGRMVGINIIFAQGGPKLGDAEAGFLAAAVGAPISVIIGGIGALIATGAVAIALPAIRKFKGDDIAV